MSRTVEISSTSDAKHKVCFGLDDDSLSNFSLKMWVTHYGKRAVDMLQSLSQGYCSFIGGDLYIHNSNNVPRNFLFGEQRYSEVGVVVNEQPHIVKVLDSIGIQSTGEWSVESITIPKTVNTPNGMLSKIPLARFKRREGVLHAEFLRNMKTSSGNISVIEAIKGESLRGESAYLVLRNTSTEQVKLFKLTVNTTKSR